MTNKKRHKSTLARSELIKVETALHYEAGNQARCYKAVWRRWIEPKYGICYRTYLNLLGLDPEEERRQDNHPSLFDEL
ncbi:hypothetical protein [Paramuribaculum intestinale]|uniref:hypothetical protein n=1 Tax=Paramuribaculum intestinale TaxID=2094151 RepID=UPI0026F2A5F1|nr:hypothetical protein [Paramuribaculum intestinale]